MSGTQAEPGRQGSPLLSNNPFRSQINASTNGSVSGPSKSGSKNPFLDSSDVFFDAKESATPAHVAATTAADPSSPGKKTMSESTREMFDQLSIDGRPKSSRRVQPQMNGAARRPENVPPRPFGGIGVVGHRPSHSEEDGKVAPVRPKGNLGELDIFAEPPTNSRFRHRQIRRNSESSVREKKPETEDEKRRRERREKRRPKQPKGMDLIDKLDVTSIYGTGLFHHEGPYDSCRPHRNRQNSRQAPMSAFPKESKNMIIGGSGPVNTSLNLDQIHGVGMEAHKDYNEAATFDEDAAYVRPPGPARSATFHQHPAFNPVSKAELVHGQETLGLGTSTFLEGAPASRAAIQRREVESQVEQPQEGGGGLSRKKSLAQKIRAVRPGYTNGRMTSPEPLQTPTSPLATGKSESGANPFFTNYDQDSERKGQQIAFAPDEQQQTGRARAPSSPRRGGYGIERKITQESMGGAGESKTAGGFLSRVKSLKGGRKPRERRDAS